MSDKYILEGHNPVIENDLLKWAEWFGNADRNVAKTAKNDILISTVFLGLDHNFGYSDIPILFETMVFGGEYDELQERYSTWEEAEKGHKEIVYKVFKER